MDVESPHVALSQQRADTLQSPVARSSPIGISDHDRADGVSDDDVMSVAYDEVRRSVSPQVAEYIFRPRTRQTSSGSSGPAKAGWSVNSLLSLHLAGPELMQLTPEKAFQLHDLAGNLWKFGGYKYVDCVAHIEEILLARESLLRPKDVSALSKMRCDLSMSYLHMDRMAECETLLTDGLCEIESLHPGSPEGDQFRLLLAQLRSSQGQHSLAEELCAKAIISRRSELGLSHYYTWQAYNVLHTVLRSQNKFNEERRLMMGFYLDVYQTVSEALLPGLRAVLAVCRSYIEAWMTESELQRLVRDRFVYDGPLGIDERNTLTLTTVFWERYHTEDRRRGVVHQLFEDLEKIMSMTPRNILSTSALLIALRIQAVRQLESTSLQQEALRVAKEFKDMKFLVPLWIFVFLNDTHFSDRGFNWRVVEQEFVHLLEDAVTKGSHYMGAPHSPGGRRSSIVSTGTGSRGSALAVDRSHAISEADSQNGSKSFTVLWRSAGQGSTPDVSLHTNGLYHHTLIPSAVPSSTILVSPRSQPTSGAAEPPAWSRSDHINPPASYSTLAWNTEPYFSHQWPAAEGEQHLDNARRHERFSPMVVGNPTPPFTFSMPLLTPHATRMSPPPRPGQDSPAAAPSSVLIGRPDFPTPPNLFGLPHSPFPPSPSLGSGLSPGS
jgi:hypothetical protein